MSENFEEFPKIARLSRGCVITEKLDGTNAQIFIEQIPGMVAVGDLERTPDGGLCIYHAPSESFYNLHAGSRNRWVTPEADNFGFAAWAYVHARELVESLGEGRHFGEWWGSGIQRGYGLPKGEKRFSLFNVARWAESWRGVVDPELGPDYVRPPLAEKQRYAPVCCHVVPVLYSGPFDTSVIASTLYELGVKGSAAAPGFFQPEGIVIWHEAARVLFKKTLERDEEPKGKRAR